MSVWLTIPSARPNGGTAHLWKAAGYNVALWRDTIDGTPADLKLVGRYPGYARAVNALCAAVLTLDPEMEWCVAGGDDTLPDSNHTPGKIAFECAEHFGGTFGVMQPTGDRFAGGSIDRICGSPWLGRAFCERAYGGSGPLYEGYRHMFVDEELLEVASKLGVLWQRPDLIHLHRHFQRESDALDSKAVAKPVPEHLVDANSPAHWAKFKTLFSARKAAGFPGHQPIAV